jgi:hypothetical protein
MLAIAQVHKGNLNNFVCEMMTGPHEGSIWVVPDRDKVAINQMVLVRYEEQDQFAHPIPLEDVQSAFDFQKMCSD